VLVNTARVLLGGTAAGAIRIVAHLVLNDALVTSAAPFDSTMVAFFVLQLLIGFATVWVYAVMRPRFGGAARTAIGAGLLTWVLAALAWSLTVIMGSVPWTIYLMRVFASLPIALIAALAGASLYRERDSVRAHAAVVSRPTSQEYR